MAVIDIHNDSKGWLTMWLEPLGEDRWLKPDEVFRVRSDYNGDELAFSINYWVDDADPSVQNINVWIENGDCYAEVTDRSGAVVECGHQRPQETNRRWQQARAAGLGE
ncbi:hypothetical protein [Streptomyces virginiae]